MAEEEKKTKAKSTKKKPAAKKTATRKVAAPEPQLAEKKYDMNTPIRCRSVRQNDLIYVATNGVTYMWSGYGDIRELPYQEVLTLKSRHDRFLYKPWLIIDDEELLKTKEFAGEFDDIYKIYREFDDPRSFFDRQPSEIREMLENAPDGLRDLIMYNAGKYIDEGILDSIGIINVIDDVLGTRLKMLL